jgi:hypothetical protein
MCADIVDMSALKEGKGLREGRGKNVMQGGGRSRGRYKSTLNGGPVIIAECYSRPIWYLQLKREIRIRQDPINRFDVIAHDPADSQFPVKIVSLREQSLSLAEARHHVSASKIVSIA